MMNPSPAASATENKKGYIFGVDIGGQSVKIGLFDSSGVFLRKWSHPTDTSEGGASILPDAAGHIREAMAEYKLSDSDIIGVGMGVPGPVDESGIVLRCVNLGWGKINAAADLEELCGFNVCVENDANLAALGELRHRCPQRNFNVRLPGDRQQDDTRSSDDRQQNNMRSPGENLVMITLGTGVGGGIILNGRIQKGFRGAAGEFSHMLVNPDDNRRCSCGLCGCLELYASASGLAYMASRQMHGDILNDTHDALGNEIPGNSIMKKSILRSANPITAKKVAEAATLGDALALDLLEELGKTLGIALSRIAVTLAPDVFVIGGGLSGAGSLLIEIIEKHYRQYAYHAVQDIPIQLAALGADAGICGAAHLAASRFLQ